MTTENGTITNVGIDKKALQEFLRSVQPPVLTPESLSEWLDKHGISIGYDEIGKMYVVGGLWDENPEQLEANLPALIFREFNANFSGARFRRYRRICRLSQAETLSIQRKALSSQSSGTA